MIQSSLSSNKTIMLSELAPIIGASFVGKQDIRVCGIGTLEKATSTDIAFLVNMKYQEQLTQTKAAAVILHEKHKDDSLALSYLISDNPYLSYAKAAHVFKDIPSPQAQIHPTAVIDPTASIGQGVAIGAHTVIEAGAMIGDHAIIGAQCYLGEEVQIGEGCRLWPQVSLYYRVQIGKHTELHSGVVLGADGFGWAKDGDAWFKIPQLGTVIIGDHVEIGANTTIDRGAIEDTIIHDGCIIDNLCMIGHNSILGEQTALAGQVGVAGSTQIGAHCLVGGQAGFGGHLKVPDHTQFHGQAMVTKTVTEPGVYASGVPIMEQKEWARTGVRFRQLPSLFARVKTLEKELASLAKDSQHQEQQGE